MAKRKPASTNVQEATAKLRAYHQLGLQLLRDHEPGVTRWADMQAICDRTGLPVHQIRTLRAFAATYTPDDLEELCGQCEQHGRPVGLMAIRHLVKFKNRRKRAQFQRRLIREGWSNVRIVAELKRVLLRKWKGGRKPTIAEDVPGVLLQLQGFAVSWRRWTERLADQKDKGVKIRLTDLSGKIQDAMAEVTKAFKAISAAVSPPQQQKKKSDGKDHAVTRKRR